MPRKQHLLAVNQAVILKMPTKFVNTGGEIGENVVFPKQGLKRFTFLSQVFMFNNV